MKSQSQFHISRFSDASDLKPQEWFTQNLDYPRDVIESALAQVHPIIERSVGLHGVVKTTSYSKLAIEEAILLTPKTEEISREQLRKEGHRTLAEFANEITGKENSVHSLSIFLKTKGLHKRVGSSVNKPLYSPEEIEEIRRVYAEPQQKEKTIITVAETKEPAKKTPTPKTDIEIGDIALALSEFKASGVIMGAADINSIINELQNGESKKPCEIIKLVLEARPDLFKKGLTAEQVMKKLTSKK